MEINMWPPKAVDLGDGLVEVSTLKKTSKRVFFPIPHEWTRVQFSIPPSQDAIRNIKDWLDEKNKGRYSIYKYTSPQKQQNMDRIVINFELRNDALMFKLKDGFQSWAKKQE
jgi:hypothetical protein